MTVFKEHYDCLERDYDCLERDYDCLWAISQTEVGVSWACEDDSNHGPMPPVGVGTPRRAQEQRCPAGQTQRERGHRIPSADSHLVPVVAGFLPGIVA